MASAPLIAVVGSYMSDQIISVDRFPRPGETRTGHGFLRAHGGKGSNQAVQAARVGGRVALVAAVGADPAGAAAREMWAAEGIDVRAVTVDAGQPTGIAMITVDAAGENQIIIDPGANRRLAPTALAACPALAEAAVVLAQLETPVETTAAAFAAATGLTVFNPAPAAAVPDGLWDGIDIVIPNETEAAALSGSDGLEAAGAALLGRVRRAAVVTAGARGVMLFERGQAPRLVAPPPVQAVDTTGAGDAFVGAFVVRLAETGDLAEAARWGVAAGSLACTARGVVPALAGRDAIAALAATLPS